MQLEELVQKFQEKSYCLNMGAGKLSKWFDASVEDVKQAKKIIRQKLSSPKSKLPKILIFDLETSPLRAYVWRRWKQNIYLDQTISEWFLLTWSARWLFSDETMSMRLTGEEAIREDDYRIVAGLWKVINEADIIIAHNGESFDTPKMNARFLIHGLPPTKPYQQIDTKKIAAKQFGFSSNKLDALAGYFGFDSKLDTDFELWSRCMDGDDSALVYMEKYNRYDVELLEEVYLKLRPWIKSHPNVGLYMEADGPVCPNCGSDSISEDGSYYYTSTGKYKTMRCKCGAVSRQRFTDYPKEKRKKLITSTAR